MGAVETLIVWENLEIDRLTLKNNSSGDGAIRCMTKEQQAKPDALKYAPHTILQAGFLYALWQV
jgi:peptide subunit release factor 1 (eRF1)